MSETITRPEVATEEVVCGTCDGFGYIEWPTCHGGSDHGGYHCGGTVCGYDEAPCPDCNEPLEFDAEGV